MINYLIDFVQRNLMIIIAILSFAILLSLSFKKVRRLMYGGLATGLTTLGFAIMHKSGLGFDSFYDVLTKIVYSVTKVIGSIQDAVMENRMFLQIVSLESDYLNGQFCVYDTFAVYYARCFLAQIYDYFFEIKVKFISYLTISKESLISKINLSRYTFSYRL